MLRRSSNTNDREFKVQGHRVGTLMGTTRAPLTKAVFHHMYFFKKKKKTRPAEKLTPGSCVRRKAAVLEYIFCGYTICTHMHL
jgi:hypothetical protein